jgi:hypothetical protein
MLFHTASFIPGPQRSWQHHIITQDGAFSPEILPTPPWGPHTAGIFLGEEEGRKVNGLPGSQTMAAELGIETNPFSLLVRDSKASIASIFKIKEMEREKRVHCAYHTGTQIYPESHAYLL